VVVDEEFELVVGLTENPEDAELNDALTIFPEDAVVDVTVCVPGCVLRPGETWRQSLPVHADTPLPAVTMHLTLPASERYRPSRTIKAVYTVPGRTLGLAVRSFAVARTEADVGRTAPPEPVRTATISPPTGPRNDLEIIIHTPSFGELSWDYTSANPDVIRPDAPITKQIGDDAGEFAKYLLRRVDDKANDKDLAEVVNGFGRMIAATIPAPVWEALRTVAAAAPPGKPPNVMILSEEPRIPWELAATEPPLRSDAAGGQHAVPVLGAQIRVGRWALARRALNKAVLWSRVCRHCVRSSGMIFACRGKSGRTGSCWTRRHWWGTWCPRAACSRSWQLTVVSCSPMRISRTCSPRAGAGRRSRRA
jgi:hypothetical protein